MDQQLTGNDGAAFVENFDADPKNRLALNAITQTDVSAVALNREVINRTTHTFSHLIETPKATNQKSTGRCWMFAGLNTLRLLTRKKMNIEEFEFSQAYLMFWDKLEKANYFLENIIATCLEPLDSRVVMWLLSDPLPDGGQWDMFIDLIEKYGAVPQAVMPETHSSSSRAMNNFIVLKLREGANQLRSHHENGGSEDDLRQIKKALLQTVHRMLCIHLGKPPAEFSWQWRDKDKKFHPPAPLRRCPFTVHMSMLISTTTCASSTPLHRTNPTMHFTLCNI
jgi:bleomycin hydrolase